MFSATFESPYLTDRLLGHLTEALTRMDVEHLRAQPHAPLLYASGVRYAREPAGAERWATSPLVLARGVGDCEDLACWRAAELRLRGDHAARVVSTAQQLSPTRRLYHVLVRHGDGRLEDPSRQLGMP